MMRTVTLTEFRSQASEMLTRVEQGERLLILRHGRPIAEVLPVSAQGATEPSWKQPPLRLVLRGVDLSSTIVAERDESVL